MADDPAEPADGAPSHDPRTWVRPASAPGPSGPVAPKAEPATSDAAASFDPRSWSERPGASADGASQISSSNRGRGPVIWAAGGVAAVIAGGLGWWALGRGGTSSAPPVAASPAAPAALSAPPPRAISPVSVPPPPAGAEHRSLTLAGEKDLAGALTASGVPAADAGAAAQAAIARLGSRPGELRVLIDLTPEGAGVALARLEARRPDGSGAVVTRAGGGWSAQAASAALTREVKVVRGEMDANSFYSSAVAAGVSDTLIPEFAQAFAFDFDFQREIKAGDVFEAAFELPKDASGQVVGPERLLFVSLETAAKSRALYRFAAPDDKAAGWFDSNGRSVVRSLMRTPVEGARVSSTFGMRVHPTLGYTKMHNGIDFAAPIGTPIYASGNASVKWAAMKGPNGNLTILTHDNGWETYYLHQNAFAPGVTPGARVRQGQTIGWIGTTGRSTGPHLHYEVHIDSKPVDPATIQVSEGRSLSGPALLAFNKERDRIDALRAAQTR